MLTAVVLLALVQALSVQASLFSHTRDGDDLVALCAGKPVDLTTVAQLRMLLHRSSGGFGELSWHKCSKSVLDALDDLDQLVGLTQGDLCASDSIDRLRAFYTRHLDTSSAEGKERERLPKSLKQFALAYGMQMSNVCKKQMVRVFKGQGRELLDNEQFKVLAALTSEQSPVARLLEGLTGPDEILLPGDLAPYLKKKDAESTTTNGDDKLYLQTGTAPLVRQLQTTCKQHFKPLYEPLMRPLIQLANMGFNYKDEPLRCDMECSATSRQLGQWSRLVFVCEALNNIVVIEDPSEGSTEGKMVRILTREEAAAIEGAKSGERHESSSNVVTLVSEPEAVALPSDVVYDRTDERLKRAIKAFKTSRSEADRLRRRMAGKGLSVLRNQVKQGHLGLMLSTGYKSLLHRVRTGEAIKPSDELVRLLDQAVEQEDQSQLLDGQVSGLTKQQKLDIKLGLEHAAVVVGFGLLHVVLLALVVGGVAALVLAVIAIVHTVG